MHCGASLSKIEGNSASDARVSARDDVGAIAAVDLQGQRRRDRLAHEATAKEALYLQAIT